MVVEVRIAYACVYIPPCRQQKIKRNLSCLNAYVYISIKATLTKQLKVRKGAARRGRRGANSVCLCIHIPKGLGLTLGLHETKLRLSTCLCIHTHKDNTKQTNSKFEKERRVVVVEVMIE